MDLQLQKWQVDKLVDWMKDNDCSSAPSLVAIDELVGSTDMKPSQIVACTAEPGGRVCFDAREAIFINEGSVPALANDVDDDGDGLIANDTAGPPFSTKQEEMEACLLEVENSSLNCRWFWSLDLISARVRLAASKLGIL
jgi:hypothetical protein